MYDYDENQRASLEQETVDFTVKVPIRDLIDLVADEAYRPEGEYSIRDISPVDVWSYLGPAAALTALKDHGWFFESHNVGRKWVEAALTQADDDKFARPIASSLYEKTKRLAILDETGTPRTVAAESTEADKRTEAFRALEAALTLDTTDDRELPKIVPIIVSSAREAVKTLSVEEKSELRVALSDLHPIIPGLHDDKLVERLAECVTDGMSESTRRLVKLAALDCYPYWGWVANSGLDMIAELLDEVSITKAEAA